MTKEEFIDKTSVANRAIANLQTMIDKIKETKMEGVEMFIKLNRKFDHLQRVKIFKNESQLSTDNKEFVGYGYVSSVFVEEDYGIMFYQIYREDKISKEMTEEFYEFSQCGVHANDYEYCIMLIETVI
jgi:hypothetical protein